MMPFGLGFGLWIDTNDFSAKENNLLFFSTALLGWFDKESLKLKIIDSFNFKVAT